MEDQIRNIEWYGFNETVLNPTALIFVLLMACLILFLPRRYSYIPYVATACFITHIQRIVVGGLDFDMIRVLMLFGILRILIKGEHKGFEFNKIDKWMLWFALFATVMHTLQLKTGSALINRLGFSFDILGIYFIFRIIVKDAETFNSTLKSLMLFVIPIAIAMSIEQITQRNLFSVFGGVPEITMFREGRLRSQGAFSHPILAGTFGAAMIPFFTAYYFRYRKNVFQVLVAIACCIIIVITSSSSGPLIAMLAGFFAMGMWKVRQHMRIIRWGTVLALIFLHLIMKDPVWALIWRLGQVVAGSTGYHRYALINGAINNFGDWWLWGTTKMAYWGWGLQDVTNQYIRIGVDGGILPLIAFLVVIGLCFKNVGLIIDDEKFSVSKKLFSWCLGSAMFVHVVSFISVSYFGQIVLFWYVTIAVVSNLQLILGEEADEN